jgi:NAD(P)H-flavin reductase
MYKSLMMGLLGLFLSGVGLDMFTSAPRFTFGVSELTDGIGLIPLRSCIMYALAHREKFGRIQIFLGARTPRDLMYRENLGAWERSAGVECHLTVDRAENGWTGNVGVVGSLFKKPGVRLPVENTIAFVCGPPAMFRFVIRDLLALGLGGNCIVSTLERYMKCGVGKCGH